MTDGRPGRVRHYTTRNGRRATIVCAKPGWNECRRLIRGGDGKSGSNLLLNPRIKSGNATTLQIRLPMRTASSIQAVRNRLLPAALLLTGLALSTPLLGQTRDQGSWRLYYQPERDRIQLTFEDFQGRGRGGMTSFGVRPSELRGLSIDQLSAASTPVRFQLVRDAGTFSFDGTIRGGRGTGFFTFAPDSRFTQQLQSRGYGRPTDDQQFQLALHDVGYPLLDEIRTEHYPQPLVADVVRMGMHGANVEYIRGLRSAGYHVDDVHHLITLRDHGVDPVFIRGLSKEGYSKLDLGDLLVLRDHGVDPDFIVELRNNGFTNLSTAQLLTARDHGVSASFARDFRDLGYTGLSLRDLVRLRDHGVTVEYARRIRSVEGRLAPIDDLIRRRDRGEA